MPLPTLQRKKQLTEKGSSSESAYKNTSSTPSTTRTNSILPSRLPSPTRSPSKTVDSAARLNKADKRRSLLPQWRWEPQTDIAVAGPQSPSTELEGYRSPTIHPPSDACQKLESDIEFNGRDDDSDKDANLKWNAQTPLKSSVPESIRAPQTLTRSQSLRRPGTNADKTNTFAQQSELKQNARISIPNAHTTNIPAGIAPDQESSVAAPNSTTATQPRSGFHRAGKATIFHKRAQSAFLKPGDHPVRPTASHARSKSNVSRNAGQVPSNPIQVNDETAVHEPKSQRPAFSTYQQHFTPKKTVKAAPAVDDINVAQNQTSVEDFRLQTELLQLHMLHESSIGVLKNWEDSAERSLKLKFDSIICKHRKLIEDEYLAQANINQAGLQQWTEGNSAVAIEDNIQCLSKHLHEVLSLSAGHGRYTNLYDRFSQWFETAENKLQISAFSFSDDLDEDWTAEHAALTRKLTGMARDVEQLPDQANDASITLITLTCRKLIKGILDELRTMLALKADVSTRERLRIDAELSQIQGDIDGASRNLGSIWGS
ncbi:hypothetical protein EV356DRAFT_533195 [Viridothelium virens]|uniref:Uncharacterized protein n=1 Tax=Viridothelium virens TaxID=1048519 RepID=A0A6A6H7S6_VIRVR|nr:hypothetical protein EV356DRAFT_533195 [Viridothelium virens]